MTPRNDFPLLERQVDGRRITYLDSASTTPKPRAVIDAVRRYYENHTANVHRGAHVLSEETTSRYEEARFSIAALVGAAPNEIVFVRNTTEAINLVAHGLGLSSEDEIVTTALEHHSNYLPWRLHARAVPLPLDEDGVPRYELLRERLTSRTKLAAVAHVSNVTGVVAPIERWIEESHARGVPVLLDASQSVSHLPVDVKALDVDFFAFSSHKMLGPSGVGALYAKADWLERFPLYQVGGGMVARHDDDRFEPREVPFRFEAGTPAIEATIGFGEAASYLRAIGMERVAEHSRRIGAEMVDSLRSIPGVRLFGASIPPERRIGLATFTLDVGDLAQRDVARLLSDGHQVIVSGGLHCAHLFHQRMTVAGTVRASSHVFNDSSDVARLAAAVREIAS
ncbi:MAG: cysteine desulfurase [Planctomycetes bacterium]|nr:cysteine desulfurase [Planctomycetota bacterium]MBI3847084.1 cysteine desulfurase [Planctomycetota bacterium]